MGTDIIELLSIKKNNNLTEEEISSKLGGKIEILKKNLRLLEEEGVIYHQKNDRYMLVSNTSLKKGIVKVTKRKGPIVVLDDNTELDLVYKDHGKLLNNDIILVDPYNKNGTAKVVKLLKREYKDYVGEIVKDDKGYKVISYGKDDIILKEAYPLGTRVLIDGKNNIIKEEIGHKDDPDTKAKEALMLNKFPIAFPNEYLEELKSIPSSLSSEEINIAKRNGIIDLRERTLVTIDGEDTKDFDDAVCTDGNIIYIAIADVNHYIKEKSAMWDETLRRGISGYPPGFVNPMTHHKLSNGICSLVPGEDRYAITLAVKIDDNGRVNSYKIMESIINNKKRMTYEDVNMFLEDNIVLDGYEKHTDMLNLLYSKAMKVKKKMKEDGFLEFSSTEIKYMFDNKKIVNVMERHQGKAEELIEFLMLLHNLTLTDYFIKNNLPFISRFHDSPDNDKLSKWIMLLKQRGYKINNYNDFLNENIRKGQEVYKDSEEKVVLDSIAIRSQAKAKYSAFNMGHFAIGVDAYATFSSPIRRLADFINQKVFVDSITYGNDYARNKWKKILPDLALIATDSERRMDKVERYMDDIANSRYMSNYIGNRYTGFVSEVTDSYIKVLLPNMVEGKIFVDNNLYKLSKDRFSLVSSSDRILIGDKIDVKLIRTNKETGEIVFIRENIRIKEYYNEEKKGKKKIKTW